MVGNVEVVIKVVVMFETDWSYDVVCCHYYICCDRRHRPCHAAVNKVKMTVLDFSAPEHTHFHIPNDK